MEKTYVGCLFFQVESEGIKAMESEQESCQGEALAVLGLSPISL